MTVLISQEGADCSSRELARLKRRAEMLLKLCRQSTAELSILLVDDERMRQLNARYRNRDRPTNVLAFPQEAEPPPAGTPPILGDTAVHQGHKPDDLTERKRSAVPQIWVSSQAPRTPCTQAWLITQSYGAAGRLLGDVAIAPAVAAREAAKLGISRERRLSWLLIHGLLHLLGYDHEQSEDAASAMARKEEELLAQLAHEERRKTMIQLAVNVDHVATLRQARGGSQPDPVLAAGICELAGAAGIVVHLREDRRHIQDRDLLLLRQTVKSKLNLEMAAAPEIIAIAHELKPDMVTLVPEKRRELTTEGGLNVSGQRKKLARVIGDFNRRGIPVSLFVDPDPRQIGAAAAVEATFIEIHTGRYCDAVDEKEREQEFNLVAAAAESALAAGLRVNAGHGLDYLTTGRIAALGTIEELSIGHAIMARAIMVGLEQAVREMLAIIRQAELC